MWSSPLSDPLTPPGKSKGLTLPLPLRLPRVDVPTWLQGLSTSLQVVVPLRLGNGEPVGLLGLGQRWDEQGLDEQDLEIFDLVGQQATLFLLTTLQLAELRRVPALVVQAQEQERAKLAGEIHDTTQQFLGRLPFFLQSSHDILEDDPQQAREILQRCITDVARESETLRQIRNALSPTLLNVSFTRAMEHLVNRFQMQTGTPAQLEMAPDLDGLLSPNARHALYRMVQQALDNITTHARAQCVKIRMALSDGHLAFRIHDDGVGCTEMQIAEAQAQGSFGLRSMEARAQSLNGVLHFRSAPGSGTTLEGWVPLLEAAEQL